MIKSLPFKIAFRYLFSKKSTNAINIIASISAAAIGVGVMALILVLSVFNGLEDLVKSLYTVFYPEIAITAKHSKTIYLDDNINNILKDNKDIAQFSYTLEENALLEYNENQHIATIKGVDRNYFNVVSGFDSFMIEGNKRLQLADQNYILLGVGVANILGINTERATRPVGIYIGKKNTKSLSNVENAFNKSYINGGGVFAISDEFDSKYTIVPLDYLQQISENYTQVSKIEIKLKDKKDEASVLQYLHSKLGDDYDIKNRYQQNEVLYKVLQSEKWMVFAILSGIIIIAAFNIIGVLSMLVLEKRKDMAALTALGFQKKSVVHLFLYEGILLAAIGTIIGTIIAIILLLLQQHVGLIKMPGESFILKYYPVKMKILDFIMVYAIVIIICLIASWLPSTRAANRIEKEYLNYLS
ncbi:MAG: ABC transporter permease [Chitinophagales bacterium]|nr:ABC transporter permease [Chitinophagales bacterium]